MDRLLALPEAHRLAVGAPGVPPRWGGLVVRWNLLRGFAALFETSRRCKFVSELTTKKCFILNSNLLCLLRFKLVDLGFCEQWDEWRNNSKAWPVANPVLTCASPTNAGAPSNFVADPFLFIQVRRLI